MKHVLYLAAVLLLAGSSASVAQQPFPYELQAEAALYKKCKVRSVDIHSHYPDGSVLLLEHRDVDEQGRVVRAKVYDEYEVQYLFVDYRYNEDGLLSSTITESEDGEYIYATEEYSYRNGKLVAVQVTSMEGAYAVYYVYDDRGRIDSSLISDAEARRNAWHYGGDNLVDSIVGYALYNYEDPDAWERTEVETFEYGKKKRLTRQAFCSDYSGCYRQEYLYKKKQKIQAIYYGPDAELYRTVYGYDKKLVVKEDRQVPEDMEDIIQKEMMVYTYGFY